MNKTTRRMKALLTAVALGVCCAYAQTATPGGFVLPNASPTLSPGHAECRYPGYPLPPLPDCRRYPTRLSALLQRAAERRKSSYATVRTSTSRSILTIIRG